MPPLLPALAALAADSVAAPAARAAARDSAPVCYIARPLPRCRGFAVTEAGYYHSVAGSRVGGSELPDRRGLDSHYAWELGYMRNRDPGSAIGGTFLVGFDDGGARAGVKARYRRWLPDRGAVDVGAGVVSAAPRVAGPGYSARGAGPSADVTLGWRDLAAVSLRAEAVRTPGRTVTGVYAGVRLGGPVAAAVTAAAGIGLVLLISAIGSD